jgi:predicted Zn-dependent protease
MMKRLLTLCIVAASIVGCSKNAITGRSQLKLVSEQELQSMAQTEYQQFLSQTKVVNASQDRDAEMVRRIGTRIASGIRQYFQSKGESDALDGYQWQFNLVQDNAANAWAMPGGKVVVYTGLLPITQNEAALAVVLGHEIAHAVLSHGNERMSQGLAAQGLQTGLSVALANKPAATQNIFMQAFGIGAQVGVLLPFSRKQELEADRYGLIFAAIAGYNPREAIPLWQRMEKASNGQKPPQFLSTHPTEGTRIEQLQKYMDEALKYYRPVSSK